MWALARFSTAGHMILSSIVSQGGVFSGKDMGLKGATEEWYW